MRISVVLPDNINTASRASKEIQTLKKEGHTINLVYMPPAYAYEDMRNPNVSKYVRIRLISRGLPKSTFFWAVKFLEFFIQTFFSLIRQRPDVVLCHDLLPLIPCFLYSKLFFKKLVYDSHEIHREILSPLKPKKFWDAAETYIINHSNITFITDHHRLNYMVEKAGVNPDKITTLYNYPYLGELRSAGKKLSDLSHSKLKVVYTGIIMPGRYIDEVVSSIPYWHADADFYLIGDGGSEYINELNEIASGLGVSERVHFVGAVKWDELVDFIDESAVAFAFYKDNCLNNYFCSPNKLYEALSSGTPVIGTKNPMIVEVLDKLDFGVCLDFKTINPKAIGEAVNLTILKNYSKDHRLKVKKQLIDNYSWESQEHQFLDVFNQAAK
jgi:glycosyltransferase involved in cell wall biosynthesis